MKNKALSFAQSAMAQINTKKLGLVRATGDVLDCLDIKVEVNKDEIKHNRGIDLFVIMPSGEKLGIQCDFQKAPNYSISFNNIGSAYLGKNIYHLDEGIIVTNGKFAPKTKQYIEKAGLKCWDRFYLISLITIAYKALQARNDSSRHLTKLDFIKKFYSFKKLTYYIINNHNYRLGDLVKMVWEHDKKYHKNEFCFGSYTVMLYNNFTRHEVFRVMKKHINRMSRQSGINPKVITALCEMRMKKQLKKLL